MNVLDKAGLSYFSTLIKEFIRTKCMTLTGDQEVYGAKIFRDEPDVNRPVGANSMLYATATGVGRDNETVRIGMGIGIGGWNRGIYDNYQGKWMINYNQAGELILDGGTTVGSATTPIYLNAGVPTACTASLSATSVSPLSVESVEALSLEEVKEHRIAELTAAFNEHVAGSFATSQGYTMQFLPEAILSLQCGIAANSTYLTQADNTTVYDLAPDVLQAVLAEMQQAYSACHARKQELRAEINAAEDKETLTAIEFEWPV